MGFSSVHNYRPWCSGDFRWLVVVEFSFCSLRACWLGIATSTARWWFSTSSAFFSRPPKSSVAINVRFFFLLIYEWFFVEINITAYLNSGCLFVPNPIIVRLIFVAYKDEFFAFCDVAFFFWCMHLYQSHADALSLACRLKSCKTEFMFLLASLQLCSISNTQW